MHLLSATKAPYAEEEASNLYCPCLKRSHAFTLLKATFATYKQAFPHCSQVVVAENARSLWNSDLVLLQMQHNRTQGSLTTKI